MKDLINEFHKDENYRVNKVKIASLINSVPGEYKAIKPGVFLTLVLEDERCWREGEKIPDHVLEGLLLNRAND